MKRALVSLLLASVFAAGGSLRAADAVALAAQQEIIESYKRLTATVEELQTTQAAQQKQISALASELSKLREELARNNSDSANKESIRRLSEQVVKVDEARLADNKRIQEALEKLGETIKKMPVGGATRRPLVSTDTSAANTGGTAVGKITNPRPGPNASSAAEEGYEYEVVSGDRPDKIAAKYQAEKINVTTRSILEANKNVDWTKLKVGQKLFIPKPKA
jgi:septal ring factor EnvC (AmiA/AmiB activator)